jgi:uncharacterized protein (TIGR04255 family)
VTSKYLPIAPDAVSDSGLPDFSQPPVDEVALSVQYPPIPGFAIPHFGLYWQKIRADFPRSEVQPPITNVTEQFGPGAVVGRQIGIALTTSPEARCWYLEQSGNRLFQLQADRFVHNWRKLKGEETYPRYPSLRESLMKEWDRFGEFLDGEGLPRPKVNQCEVLYVNHIEYDKGWNGYGDLDKVIATMATPKRKNRFLPPPERASMQMTYRLDGDAGRLYVAFGPVIRGRDGKEVMQMTLTARGAPSSPRTEDVFAWLDMGRKWVVRGFADFTTEAIQRIWGKQ